MAAGDLTAHLLQQLEHHGFPAHAKFHYVYVDEVQDLTVAQLALLKYLCHDARSGYLFAGDTAQVVTT
jgi:superfamily I DNA/RNA helicase